MGVGGYGYPALVGLNAKKGVLSALRGAFADQAISAFVAVGASGFLKACEALRGLFVWFLIAAALLLQLVYFACVFQASARGM